MYRLSKSLKYPLLRQQTHDKKDVASKDLDWHKVGEVKAIYTYPMFEGRRVYTPICIISELGMFGIAFKKNVHDFFRYRNEMFAAYNCKTNCIIKAIDNIKIRDIEATYLDNANVKISFFSSFITVNLHKILVSKVIKCITSFCHKPVVIMLCFDCGPEATEWISRCLGDKDARLAYHALEKPKPKTPYWKLCQRLHSAQQDEKFYGAELDERFYERPSFTPILDYKLSPLLNYDLLSKPLTSAVQPQKLRSNIIIKVDKFDDLSGWKWIMIGSTILKYPKYLPRRQKFDLETTPIELLVKFIPLHCELLLSGIMKVGEDVFVKKAPPPLETIV
ncbi:uncharacterized protein LOC116852743 [Odontomachus brunneus]|uniref:uncharacterized protein LOC116852743 n=1 Tax=Odontomachus brunneus TaxID=486640 RepID=UPI0013F1CABD|nr:uncharacterized protein LOC116852743 [Odontomachus brunneus]